MMNVVNSGSRFQIYGEDVKTYRTLPVGSYEVEFHKMIGFYLTSRPDLVVNEKIYGDHAIRAEKVMKSYSHTDRNFGIILSGQKGIGKSLFARVLANKAIEKGMPVIVVTGYIPGIAGFISSIQQECVVIFDEFEKTFAKSDDCDPQTEMLSLFDGLDGGNKLFVVTCNDTSSLSSFMLNRPGRFHYHIKISNPTDVEIVEYMQDKLDKQYWDTIEQVVNFSHGVNMTYDFLRAIAFELNQGYSLKETLRDLNITDAESMKFDITLVLNNGMKFYTYGHSMDLTRKDMCWAWVQGSFSNGEKHSSKRYSVQWRPSDIIVEDGKLCLKPEHINVDLDEEELWDLSDEEEKKAKEDFKKIIPVGMYFEKVQTLSNGARFIDV